ncbi:hypothetical protein Hanom_Chr01g00088091 [Helianthus anomalus]
MPVERRMEALASSSLLGFRARMVTRAPSAAAWRARAKPMPLEPPVMNTWRDLIGIVTGWGRIMSLRKSKRRIGRMQSVRNERLMSAICDVRRN